MTPKKDTLWRITLTAHSEAEEAVAEFLEQRWGIPSVRYCPEEGESCAVSLYTDRLPAVPAMIRAECRLAARRWKDCGLAVEPLRCSIRRIPREDWAESWKRHFKPFSVGQALLVKPSWSRRIPRPDQAVIELDPGLSFGTGQHPTTRFCLDRIVRLRQKQPTQSLVDIGTGSGILAIAAVKLGYRPVRAFDFDPAAVKAARQNARHNRVDRRLAVTRQDLSRLLHRSIEPYDIVCANLEFDLVIAEHHRLIQHIKPGGFLLLAGILERQFPQVLACYQAQKIALLESRTESSWQSGLFQRPLRGS